MLLSFLKKPYPYLGDLKKDLFRNLMIGCFVAFFLIVFEPFEINLWQTPHKTLKLAGFGLISFLIPGLIGLGMRVSLSEKIREEQWTVGREILLLLTVLILIAAGNLIYGKMLTVMPFNANAYAFALVSTCLVGIFPVGLHVLRKHNHLLKRNLEQSLLLNQELRKTEHQAAYKPEAPEPRKQTIVLTAENEKDKLSLSPDELLFIESADNYATVVSISEGKKKKELLRSSLKRMEGQLDHPDLIRCHRAYIVNLAKIKTVEGNAAGYKLYLDHTDQVIPVSRNYVQAVNDKLKSRT